MNIEHEKIVTNMEEYGKYLGVEYVHLNSTQEIERRFYSLFNQMLWKKCERAWKGSEPGFDTDFDYIIMREVDHAHRCDLQVVKTDIGTAPLTCLSTGCKFGILVNYYTQRGFRIVASWGSAGENVFELIGREMDITIYMDRRTLIDYDIPYDLKNIKIDGSDMDSFVSESDKLVRSVCTVTSERLKNAQKRMISFNDKYIVKIPLSMECDYQGLHKLLGNICINTVLDYVEDYPFLKEIKYYIRTMEIKVDTQDKYPTLWVFKKYGATWKFLLHTIYKFPRFMRMICEMEELYQEDIEAEEIFMVVFDTQGYVIVDGNYPDYMAYGLIYTPQEKKLEVIGVRETVDRLNAIAENTEIEAP